MNFLQNGNQLINSEYIIQTDSMIGQGAQGQVFECRKKITIGQAIQLCAKIQVIKQETTQFIQREQEILQSLQQENNQNLVKTYFFTMENNLQPPRFITIMERCQGNMDQFQKLNPKMNERDLIDFFQQILKGYKSLYEKNIVHRDLKPENILYTQQTNYYIYKLADFGIGKLCKWQDKNNDLTQVGTLQHSAPELNQSCNKNDFTQSLSKLKQSYMKNWKSCVDIFSLGLIVYQLYFGKLPYENKKQQIQFFDQLKQQKMITLPQNISLTNQNQKIIAFIQQSIVYYPDERISFEKLFQYFGIQSGIQFNQAGINQSFIFPNQQQQAPKQFSTINFIQYQDCSKYLQQLLLQNEKLYCPMTLNWIQKVKTLFDNQDKNNLILMKEELKTYFPFKDEYQTLYSQDYIKFQQQLQKIFNEKLLTSNFTLQK